MSDETVHEDYCGYPDDCNCVKVRPMTTDLEQLDALRAAATPALHRVSDQVINTAEGDEGIRRAGADLCAITDVFNAVGPLIERVKAAESNEVLVELRELWNRALADKNEAIRLMSELMQRTPSMGEDKDGFIMGYVLPTGPLHRIASFLTQHGQSFGHVKHYADEKFANADPIARAEAAEARVKELEARVHGQFDGASLHGRPGEPCEVCEHFILNDEVERAEAAESRLAALEAGIRALAEKVRESENSNGIYLGSNEIEGLLTKGGEAETAYDLMNSQRVARIRALVEPYLLPTAGPEAQGLADEILSLLPDKDTPDAV